jgi:enoyl-CoA hydratase/carnithine racemase
MKVQTNGAVCTFTLDRPEKRNALNAETWHAILQELRKAEADPEIAVIVIRGEGPVFCAGNDIRESESFPTAAAAKSYFLDNMATAMEAMARSPLPIVAEVHGSAMGGGFELLQFCDLVYADEQALFQLPETRLGLWATVFVGATHPMGQRRAVQELALTTRPYTAAEAADAGFITKAVSSENLRTEVQVCIESLLTKGKDAMARSKRYANRALINEGLVAVRDALEEHCNVTIFSADGIEGVKAFVEKRTPIFAAS